MDCLISSGRLEPCKDAIGGNKNAYFINYVEDAFTVAAQEATAINAAVTEVFKYELRADGNTLSEATVSDFNAGTTITTQTTTLVLKKQDKDTALQVDLMSKGRPIIVLEDRMGNFKLIGHTDGNDLTGSDIASGGAKADFNGYNLTFTATEGAPAPYLDSATVTALLALVV